MKYISSSGRIKSDLHKGRQVVYYRITAEILNLPHPSKEAIVETALEFVGAKSQKYIHNHPELGQTEQGFDCSGFVRFVLLRSGFHIPDFIGMDNTVRPIRHTNEFWDHYGVAVQTAPEAGDLIFFSRGGVYPTHIGIVRDEGSFIHAPGKDGTSVVVRDIVERPISSEQEGRVLFNRNPIGYKAPVVPSASATYRHHQALAD